jgi:dihydrofolate reductase
MPSADVGGASWKDRRMATIRAHEFISLDGVFESPSWTMEFGFVPAMGDAIGALTGSADAILLGRTTYEMFAPAWRDRTVEDDPGAPFFNDTEKYVVGGQPLAEEWGNTTPLGAYDASRLRDLKADRDLFVSGSGRLVRGLIADGLLDELHLFVFPIALGTGERLFADSRTSFETTGSQVFDNGVVHLTLVARA